MENDMEKLSREEMSQILKTSHTVAVVGLSSKPNRPGYSIPAYLQEQGYRIIPVNPTINEALGEKAYASLHEIPESVDIVQVFRRSEEVPPVVEDAIAIGAKVVWMQLVLSTNRLPPERERLAYRSSWTLAWALPTAPCARVGIFNFRLRNLHLHLEDPGLFVAQGPHRHQFGCPVSGIENYYKVHKPVELI
jgi:uncharacterized protein